MSDLTSVAAVKAYLGKTDGGDDTVLQSMVTAYSEWVRTYTSRGFSVETYDIWRSGRGNVVMMVPQWPVVSVVSVRVDDILIPAAPSFGAYGHRFSERMVTLSGGACFSPGCENVHIVYTAGYAIIPKDIANAVCEMVALRYRLRDKLEWSSKSLAGETVTLVTRDMPASVKTVLDQYTSRVPA